MTIRRINHTGRARIKREHVAITLKKGPPRRSEFVATLALSGYDLPSSAAVFVEAYALSVCQRFSFGRIGNYSPPATLRLSDFDHVDALKFRVRVVEGAEGKKHIFAEADKISPRLPDEDGTRTPLLPVRATSELGEEVFRLDDTDSPVLLINSSVGDWKAMSTDPMFVALAYPSVLRQVLSGILIQNKHDDVDDPDDWRSLWLRFALSLPNIGSAPDVDNTMEVREWIDTVVDSFARTHRTLEMFKNAWSGEPS